MIFNKRKLLCACHIFSHPENLSHPSPLANSTTTFKWEIAKGRLFVEIFVTLSSKLLSSCLDGASRRDERPADGSYDRLVIDWQNSCRHKNIKLRIKQAAAT